MKRYSLSEMKAIWRRRLGLLSRECGCTVTADDYTDMELLLEDRIRSWYASLLQTAPFNMIPLEEMADEIPEATRPAPDILIVQLPLRGVRPASVQSVDWQVPVSVFYDPDSYEGRLQTHPCTRASWRIPVVVKQPRSLILYGLKPDPQPSDPGGVTAVTPPLAKVKSLLMVAPPADRDTFVLDQSLLETIPEDL